LNISAIPQKQDIFLCLQGGGSACAWQAGAILAILQNPYLNIVGITGTSGGALNGAILKQAFAIHGQGEAGRSQAETDLTDAWMKYIAKHDIVDQGLAMAKTCQTIHNSALNAMLGMPIDPMSRMAIQTLINSIDTHNRTLFTKELQQTLNKVIPDETALQSDKGPFFGVQVVHDKSGMGRFISGKDLKRKFILASAALRGSFHAVNGYVDGAHFGGANPAFPPLPWLQTYPNVEIIYINTSQEPKNILPKLQSDLTQEDLADGELIIQEVYREIAYMRQMGHNITTISPKEYFTAADKGLIGQSVLAARMDNGYLESKEQITRSCLPALAA
jgi:NTE family protein